MTAEKDIYYPWAHLVAELLRRDIEETKEVQRLRSANCPPEWIELAKSMQASAQAEYRAALTDWVNCVLRYNSSLPLVKSHQEAISILLPSFDWGKYR